MTEKGITIIYEISYPNGQIVSVDEEDYMGMDLPEGCEVRKITKDLYGYVQDEEKIEI